MGGVGKTTVAQLVYNDRRVQEQFELRAWVCVSEEMDSRKVAKDILKEIGFLDCDTMGDIGFLDCDTMGDNGLHCKLEEELKKKKILLVLDDVWSDNEAEWDSCLIPFKSVRRGSKIIVTTRIEKVALVKSTIPSYSLQTLSAEDCWDLFVHHAFSDERSPSIDDQNLITIGRKLVEKCKGLPLVAKALGSQLRHCKDVEVWERMLKSNLWDVKDDKILPALRLSYYSLPKDYRFEEEELTLLWMAEGFIVQPRGSNKEMAEICDDYFQELVSRSFFQSARSFRGSFFAMHDLMHDLAESVCGEFCVRLEDEKSGNPSKTTRHLSISRYNLETKMKLEGIQESFGLRTFLLFRYTMTPIDVLDFVVKLRCLRVLSLQWIPLLTELPDSIGELKHLRFLDLSWTLIETLPEAVSNLHNLQTLILDVWHLDSCLIQLAS